LRLLMLVDRPAKAGHYRSLTVRLKPDTTDY
jgi:hypothetical protein